NYIHICIGLLLTFKVKKMRFTKPLFISSVMAFALAGCSTTKNQTALDLSKTPMITADGAVKKKGKIEEKDLQRWSHLDLIRDSIPGMSVDRAYSELIKGVKGQKVIVGIIDSGIDIEHPDLAPVIWTNQKEIPNNGKDDDKNGYVDDIHGWNFLGNAIHENYEFIRLLKKPNDGSEDYKRAEREYEEKIMEAKAGMQQVEFFLSLEPTIKNYLKKNSFTLEDVKAINTKDETVKEAKETLERILAVYDSLDDFYEKLEPKKKYYETQLKIMEAKAGMQQVEFFLSLEPTIKNYLKKNSFTLEDVKAINTKDETVKEAKETLERILAVYDSLDDFYEKLEPKKKYYETQIK